MTGFESEPSCVTSDCSVNSATTTIRLKKCLEPWWRWNGRYTHLLIWRSAFESCCSQQFLFFVNLFERNENKRKRATLKIIVWPPTILNRARWSEFTPTAASWVPPSMAWSSAWRQSLKTPSGWQNSTSRWCLCRGEKSFSPRTGNWKLDGKIW